MNGVQNPTDFKSVIQLWNNKKCRAETRGNYKLCSVATFAKLRALIYKEQEHCLPLYDPFNHKDNPSGVTWSEATPSKGPIMTAQDCDHNFRAWQVTSVLLNLTVAFWQRCISSSLLIYYRSAAAERSCHSCSSAVILKHWVLLVSRTQTRWCVCLNKLSRWRNNWNIHSVAESDCRIMGHAKKELLHQKRCVSRSQLMNKAARYTPHVCIRVQDWWSRGLTLRSC